MKGGENRHKKRKQLWRDRSSLGGGSWPEGLAVCYDSAPRRGGHHPKSLPTQRHQMVGPLPLLPSQLGRRSWNELSVYQRRRSAKKLLTQAGRSLGRVSAPSSTSYKFPRFCGNLSFVPVLAHRVNRRFARRLMFVQD